MTSQSISVPVRQSEVAFNPIFAVVKVSEHTSVYRGFSITRLKRNKITPVTSCTATKYSLNDPR